jgi:protein phosphatase
VRTDEIGRVISEEPDLVAVCKRLIDLANEAGGPDNITVVAARFDGDGLDEPDGEDDVGHHVFQLHSESRDTVPVPVFADDDDTPTLPTGEVPQDLEALAAPVPPVPPPVPLPTPVPRGPGVGTLRLLFAFAFVLVAGYFVVRWIQQQP